MLRRPGSGVRSGMFNFGLLSLAVTSAAVLTATPATSETLLARRPLSAYPKAICNDATTASYYFANATSGSKDFVLYLQGGSVFVCAAGCLSHYRTIPLTTLSCRGWCYDASSCAKRKTLAPFLTSSKFQLPEHVGKGILSNKEEETPLFAAAKAYVAYCTSDAHMGAREEVDPSSGFFFRGAEVLKAVVSDLVVREVGVLSERERERERERDHSTVLPFIASTHTGFGVESKPARILWWLLGWRTGSHGVT